MRRILQGFTIAVAVVLGFSSSPRADDFAMPYACRIDSGGVSLQPSSETIYRIAGTREEQPFSSCGSTGGSCETMMVHRFQVACGGGKASITHIAEAARKIGVIFPTGLPPGFVPVGPLAGRFIFPALTMSGTHVAAQVTAQSLSPDSVRDTPAEAVHIEAGGWQTNVSADIMPGDAGSAGRVVLVLAGVLMLLIAACLVAAGRWRPSGAVSLGDLEAWMQRLQHLAARFMASLAARWQAAVAEPHDQALVNALAIAQARLSEVELNIAGLPQDLLLRDVLLSEAGRIRPRLASLEKEMHRRAPEKSAAMVRVILKDLDRIQRIAQSAAASNQPRHEPERDAFEIPRSLAEAYRVLGINPDAAPAAAKKLIDALRLSWHPDHARDDADRQRREARMKQINAAWDLINGRRAAA